MYIVLMILGIVGLIEGLRIVYRREVNLGGMFGSPTIMLAGRNAVVVGILSAISNTLIVSAVVFSDVILGLLPDSLFWLIILFGIIGFVSGHLFAKVVGTEVP